VLVSWISKSQYMGSEWTSVVLCGRGYPFSALTLKVKYRLHGRVLLLSMIRSNALGLSTEVMTEAGSSVRAAYFVGHRRVTPWSGEALYRVICFNNATW